MMQVLAILVGIFSMCFVVRCAVPEIPYATFRSCSDSDYLSRRKGSGSCWLGMFREWLGAREVRCIELDIVMASRIVMGHAILWRGTRAWWILVAVTKRSAQLP
jgi:hypothetical protein